MKAGMNTLIAKIGIAAAIVAVIAAGAVFLIKNSGDEEASGGGTGDAQEQTEGREDGNDHMAQTAEEDGAQGQTSGGESDEQGQVLEFSGDWDAVEEAGYPPFWLKYANLGALEEKDLSDLMFYDKFAFGASLEEMLSSYNYFSFDTGYERLSCNSWEEFMECAAINTIRAKGVRNIWCYTSEDNYDDCMTIPIYNLTDSEITIWECIENGQFFVGYDTYSSENPFKLFGVPYERGSLADNREALAELVEILGKPTAVANCTNSNLSAVDREEGEEFSETVSLGGGGITYYLIYDKGDYILEIRVIEQCINSNSVTTVEPLVMYLTRDVYEYNQERYPDSPEIIRDVYDFE